MSELLDRAARALSEQLHGSAYRAIAVLLAAAWLSVAAYLILQQWLAPPLAATTVAAVAVLIAALQWPRQSASAPADATAIDPALLKEFEALVKQYPWLATGLGLGLGWACGRGDIDLRALQMQLGELMAALRQPPADEQPD